MNTEQITDTPSGQHTHHHHSGESTHSNHHHSHSNHHHSHSKRKHRPDSAEREKNKRLSAAKRRKLFARILFILLSVIAVTIALATIILYVIPDSETPILSQ